MKILYGVVPLIALAVVSVVGYETQQQTRGKAPLLNVEQTTPSRQQATSNEKTAPKEEPQQTVLSTTAVSGTPVRSNSPATTITIAGTVSLSNGQAASGAEVVGVHWELNKHEYTTTVLAMTQSDEAGHYRLQVSGEKLGFLKYSRPGSLDFQVGAGTLESSQTGSVVRDVTLPAACTVSGRVVEESGRPAAGVKLSAILVFDYKTTHPAHSVSDQTVSSADGSFLFRKVPPGPINVWVQSEDYPFVSMDVTAPAENVLVQLPRSLSVEGHAFLLGTQQPVSSVTVMLLRAREAGTTVSFPGKASCVTDGNGAFRVGGAMPGLYRLTVASNLTSYQVAEEVPVDLRQTSVSGVRLLLYDGAWLTGKTIDSITRKPVEGVTVRPSGYHVQDDKNDPSAVSGKDGAYWLRLSGARMGGGANICAVKSGYRMRGSAEHAGSIDGKPYTEDLVTVRLDPGTTVTVRDIEMEPLAGISGKVVAPDDGPIAGAHVELVRASSPASDETRLDGKFSLETRPFIQTRVKAGREGYGTTITRELRVGDKVLSGVEITLAPEGLVSGTVKDPDGILVEGARLNASVLLTTEDPLHGSGTMEQLQNGETGAGGSFTLKGLPGCQVRLCASHDGFLDSETTQVQVQAGEEVRGIALVLQKKHFLAGTIRNPQGKALEAIDVSAGPANGGGRTVTTDREGRYRVGGLAAGPLNVYVGHQHLERDIHKGVPADSDNADFVFDDSGPQSGRIIGTVVDVASKQKVKDFTVNGSAKVRSEETGRFVLPVKDLFPMEVTIAAPGYASNTFNVALSENMAEVERTFEIGRGGSLKGRVVTGPDHKPLARVEVTNNGRNHGAVPEFITETISRDKIYTDSDGRFSFNAIAAGTITLQFKPAPPLRDRTAKAEIVDDKQTDMGDVFIGEGSVVTGRLLRIPSLAPVAGEEVRVARFSSEQPWQTVQTGPDGAFRFEGLSEGRVCVFVPHLELQ